MNKTEFIAQVAQMSDMPKSHVGALLENMANVIKMELAEGRDVQFVGFGTFSSKKRSARTGRNPQNGEPIDIPEKTVPVFKPGSTLKALFDE